MKDALIVSLLSLMPRNAGARGMGVLARSGLSRLGMRAFVSIYGLNMDEAAEPIAAYPTLEALFTRKLKPGVRPIDEDPGALISPVDGRVAFVGRTEGGAFEVAPGRMLTAAELLGEEAGERDVAVIYLSPKDYHRIHAAREGRATAWSYLPGTLWPVFPAAVERVDRLFARNERVWVRTETDLGPLDTIMIGAFGVGRITTTVCDVVSNSGAAGARGELSPPVPVGRGDELGTFHLGSTVVLLLSPGSVRWTASVGDPVRLGRPIARVVSKLTGPV